MSHSLELHPDTAIGWTHVWDGQTQLSISDDQAAALVFCRMIRYSPDNGPNAKVYRPLRDLTNTDIEKMLT